MKKCIAIITARGGSKRIPRKNIKNFLGKPIIAYSIDAALEAGCFDEVMVSTDDQEIAAIARQFGAKIPFYRSDIASSDHATTADVLAEVLDKYSQFGELFEYACCIYPTAPFVTADKLRLGHELLLRSGASSAMPVVKYCFPIQRALKIENNRLGYLWPEHAATRSQDLVPAYHDSGQFYWIRVDQFIETRTLVGKETVPIIVPEAEVHDIDTEEDWRVAEIKYQILRQSGAIHG